MRLLLTVVIVYSVSQSAQPQTRTYDSYRVALKAQQTMLRTITIELRKQHRSGIIELNGRCYADALARSSPLRLHSPKRASNVLVNLLGQYGDFEVRENDDDTSVIRERGVSQVDLDIVLPTVVLHSRDRNDPNAAMEAIMADDAVTSALANRRVSFVGSWEKLQAPPSANAPLSSRVGNAPLETVIHALLKAFPGVAVYQECEKTNGEKLITISFDRY